MKTTKTMVAIILAIIVTTSCEKSMDFDMDSYGDQVSSLKAQSATPKATGSVEFIWKGGMKGGDMGNKPDALLAFFEFNAHEASLYDDAKGEIVYTVTKLDTTLHREIRAEVLDVLVDRDAHKAWFIGKVISDTKGCDGNDSGGHDSGCSDDGHTDDGGCGDDDTSHDGGCSHDDTGDDGTTHDDGGCSHDDTGDDGTTHDDGGCSGSTGEDDHSGGSGGDMGGGSPGGSTMGNPLSGKNCRIGQLIVVKVHDVATPGMAGDGLTWKWFSPEGDFVPAIDNIAEWPHLCKKIIIGGNLVVH